MVSWNWWIKNCFLSQQIDATISTYRRFKTTVRNLLFEKQNDTVNIYNKKDKESILVYRILMIGKNLTSIPFQTFFVSREISNCPLIADIIKLGKKIDGLGIVDNKDYSISVAYGKRILINAKNVGVESMNQQDIIEIADYDPVKNIILAIGKKDPCIESPVHWLIHHARDDVNAIIQLNGEKVVKKFSKNLPTTEKEYPSGTLELAKEVLKVLRASKKILIKNRGSLFVGISLKEVEDLILKTYGESK